LKKDLTVGKAKGEVPFYTLEERIKWFAIGVDVG
jgi:ribosome modulation factor